MSASKCLGRVLAALVIGLSACTPAPTVRELSNASINNLMAQPLAQYFATLRLASALAAECAGFAYDTEAAEAITLAKTRGNRALAAQNAVPIDVESDLVQRSFQARNSGFGTCDALAREVEKETALSAVVVKIR